MWPRLKEGRDFNQSWREHILIMLYNFSSRHSYDDDDNDDNEKWEEEEEDKIKGVTVLS